MSLGKMIRAQLGLSGTNTQNFTWTAENADGSLQLQRGVQGSYTQQLLNVDSSGNANFTVGLLKANSIVQALSDFTGSNQSLAANGYQKLPGGLIIQWGANSFTPGGAAVTFPIAFTTAVYIVGPIQPSLTVPVIASAPSVTGFTATSSSGGPVTAFWIAIGK